MRLLKVDINTLLGVLGQKYPSNSSNAAFFWTLFELCIALVYVGIDMNMIKKKREKKEEKKEKKKRRKRKREKKEKEKETRSSWWMKASLTSGSCICISFFLLH